MRQRFLNPYLFFIISDGKFIVWDYLHCQQFELEDVYLSRLVDLSKNPTSFNELDPELEDANLINSEVKKEEWGWDCLSKIFHFGTKVKKEDLLGIDINDASSFSSEYIRFSEARLPDSPSLLTEKKGELIVLPKPDLTMLGDSSFLSILYKRKTCRTFYHDPVDLNVLSVLLYLTFGHTNLEDEEYAAVGLERVGLRKTSPSGGGLHSSEAYLIVQNINGLEKGIYHYQSHNHILTLINTENFFDKITEIFCGQHFIKNIPFGIFITSRFEKLWHKYPHSRAYRIALLDAGHLSQTFQLVSTALNLNPWLSGAFIDDEVVRLLKLENLSEQPLFFIGAGLGPWSSLDPITKKLAIESKIKNVFET